jgi:hypothetical protein
MHLLHHLLTRIAAEVLPGGIKIIRIAIRKEGKEMPAIRRAMTVTKQWERVNRWPNPDPVLDEDYVLRFGEYLLTVSTRAEYTTYSIYRGDYTRSDRLTGAGYSPVWEDGDWFEGLLSLTEDALLRVSQPMMRAAEVALRDLLRTQSAAAFTEQR